MDQAEAQFDVFLSHSTGDKAWADAVCAFLESKHGLKCWIAPRDISPGTSWGAGIMRGINTSRVMLLVFSGRSNDSPHVLREVERAVNRRMPILPVRIDDRQPTDDMEFFLSATQWLNAFKGPVQVHLGAVANAVKALLPKPAPGQTRPIHHDVAQPRSVSLATPPKSAGPTPSKTTGPQPKPAPAPPKPTPAQQPKPAAATPPKPTATPPRTPAVAPKAPDLEKYLLPESGSDFELTALADEESDFELAEVPDEFEECDRPNSTKPPSNEPTSPPTVAAPASTTPAAPLKTPDSQKDIFTDSDFELDALVETNDTP